MKLYTPSEAAEKFGISFLQRTPIWEKRKAQSQEGIGEVFMR